MTELIVAGPVLPLNHWSSDGRRVDDVAVGQLPLPLLALIEPSVYGTVGWIEEVRFILARPGPTVWVRARVTNEMLAERFTSHATGRLPCGVDLHGGTWTFDDYERSSVTGARLDGVTVYLRDEIPAFDDVHLAVTHRGLAVDDVPVVAP